MLNNGDRLIAALFTNRFAPLSRSLTGATVSEVALHLQSEADFVGLQKPENAFLARVFWNTVLVPVIAAWRDVRARQRELDDVYNQIADKRNALEKARTTVNATTDTLLQHARDYEHLQTQLEMRQAALNHALSRLNALFPSPNESTIQHVQT